MVNDNMNGGLRDKDNYVYDENIFPLSKLDDFSQALVGRSREIIDELNRRWAAMGQPLQLQMLRILNSEPPWDTGNDNRGIFIGMIMDINAELLQAENAVAEGRNDRGRKSRRKKRKSAKRKSAKCKSAKRKSAKRKSAKRKSAKRKSAKRKRKRKRKRL